MSVHMKVAIIGPCLWTDETKKLFLSCAYMGEGQKWVQSNAAKPISASQWKCDNDLKHTVEATQEFLRAKKWDGCSAVVSLVT